MKKSIRCGQAKKYISKKKSTNIVFSNVQMLPMLPLFLKACPKDMFKIIHFCKIT